MKVFAWIHRKLHANVDYSMISPENDSFSVKKSLPAALTCDHDGDHVPLVDVLGNGILSIGTFGIELKSFEFQDEEEYGAPEEQQELNPLAVTAFEQENVVEMESQPLLGVGSENPVLPFVGVTEFGGDDGEKRRKERTTLADLFKADAEFVAAEKAAATEGVSGGNGEKKVRATKHVLALAKKVLNGKKEKGEDSRPTTKLHSLIKRMVKRKIHPHLEGKISEGIGYNTPSKIGATHGGPGLDHNLTTETAGNESRSLLKGAVSSCA